MVISRPASTAAAPVPRRMAPPAGPAPTPRRRPPSRALQRRNRRVEAHRELVRPLALHYARCSGECGEDLIQVGLMGLIRAAELYRAATTTPFEAFARPHIRGAILHYLRDLAPRVRLPRRQAERLEQLQRLERRTAAEPGRLELELQRAGLDPEQCRLLLRHRRLCRAVALEPEQLAEIPVTAQVGEDPADGADGDADRCADGPWDGSAERSAGRAATLLQALPADLGLVVQRVVLEGVSYRSLAAEIGVSPMTVQRRLQRGLDSLRQAMAGEAA